MLLALACALASAPAFARAAAPLRLQIVAQPARSALIELALQADLSLGGDLDACVGVSAPLSGRFALADALGRLLRASGCTYAIVDGRTVVIGRRRPAPASPPPSPARVAAPKQAGDAVTEVVVTGLRSADLPGRLPYAISAAAGADLARDRVSDLESLSSQIAGMTVTNLGRGRDKVMLRGLSDGIFTGQTQSTVALYLDDVPVTYNAPDPDLRLADVERVEVMRGPQGTLYGGGSIGGVVRIVTRKPDLDNWSVGLSAGISAMATGGAGHTVEGVVNAPLLSGRLAARLVAYQDAAPGYIANSTIGRSHINASQRGGARLTVKAALTPDWTLSAALTHQSINNDDTQYGLARLGPLRRDNRLAEAHDNDFDQASATVAGAGDWGRVTLSTARLGHSFDSRYDASAMAASFGGPAGPTPFDERKTIDLAVTEAVYVTPGHRRLHGLVGGFFSTGESRLLTALTTSGGAKLYGEDRTDKINEAALYGEATLDLTPRLSVTGGLRWFDFQFETNSRVDQGAAGRALALRGEATGASPKILVSYANAGSLIYIQAAEGYRPGGFNTGGTIGQAFDSPGNPQRRYRDDELWNYEAGFKTHWFDDRLQLRLAAYLAVWKAVQSDQFLPQGLGYTANIGDGKNRGVELEAAWNVIDSVTFRASMVFNNPELTRVDPNFRAATDDASLPGIARASASLIADYHRPLASGSTLRLQGAASYVGRSTLNFDGLRDQRMGGYLVFGLGAKLEAGSWTLGAAIDNLLDSAANTFSFGNPFLLGKEEVVTPLRPRTATLTLSRTF